MLNHFLDLITNFCWSSAHVTTTFIESLQNFHDHVDKLAKKALSHGAAVLVARTKNKVRTEPTMMPKYIGHHYCRI